jgi:hypothetical protein
MNCKNCNSEVPLHYCPNCGQAATLKRINGHYIIHEIEHVLHLEKGILYTIRELLVRPGENVRRFVSENRSRLVKPIIFIIVTSLIYTLVSHSFHIEEGYAPLGKTQKSSTGFIFKWVQDHYGYSNIIMGIFIALWLKFFFREHNYNLYEILILLCFVMGMGMLFLTVFVVFQGLTHVDFIQTGSLVSIVYCTWAIGQFFGSKKPTSYVKAFVSYMLGMVTFWTFAFLSGALIDLAAKH